MNTSDQSIAQDVPEALAAFVREICRLSIDDFIPRSPAELPDHDRRLLVHGDDMTSTLATHHGSPLRVEVLQRRRSGELYLREVFLRTRDADLIVEYGVIAIALDSYLPAQQAAILAGETPLGAVLHQFQVPFVSSPLGFFSVTADQLAATPLAPPPPAICFGRFNQLAKPAGDPLAWIIEILPPA